MSHLIQLVVRQYGCGSYCLIYLIFSWIHCDNQSCVKLSKNLVFYDKSKHIEIKYHYIRDMVQGGAVKLQYVVMKEQIADVLTKPLARLNFEYFRERLGVLHIEVPSKRK